MTVEDEYDVIIVGAGINGCVAARELAPDHDVLVVDRGHVAGDTTGKASGLVSIVRDYDDHPAAARHALDFFEAYDGTGSFEYTERANLHLVEPDAVAARRAEAERFRDAGHDVAFLEPDAVEARYPDTFHLEDFGGALEFRKGGWVDPYTLAVTLMDEARDDGATLETDVTVEDIIVQDGRVAGVRTDEGDRSAPAVVVAAGWRTRDLVAPWVALPVRPFRYQTVNLETDREFDERFPVAWERKTRLYWRPEHNGDLHVGGGTVFSTEPPQTRTAVTETFRRMVAGAMPRYLKGIEDARIASDDTCPTGDAATPDGYPIIDAPDGAPGGLVVATGMHGFGIMAAPATGAAVRALVADEPAPFDLDPFALDRFDDRSTDFGSPYIADSPDDLPSP